MSDFKFKIEKRLDGCLGRIGIVSTPHGDILTPSFVVVGTKYQGIVGKNTWHFTL